VAHGTLELRELYCRREVCVELCANTGDILVGIVSRAMLSHELASLLSQEGEAATAHRRSHDRSAQTCEEE